MDARQNQLNHIRGILHAAPVHGQPWDSINSIRDLCYETAVANGWHDEPRDPAVPLLLLVTEIAEAYEDIRILGVQNGIGFHPANQDRGETMDKPVGLDIELADILIRLLDLCGEWGVDLALAVHTKMIYNTTRSYRHGGKTA